jgi:hypothetical protein
MRSEKPPLLILQNESTLQTPLEHFAKPLIFVEKEIRKINLSVVEQV